MIAPSPAETTGSAASKWQPIETAPRDRLIEFYAPSYTNVPPECEPLPAMIGLVKWHPDGGFCVDELREPSHWREHVPPAENARWPRFREMRDDPADSRLPCDIQCGSITFRKGVKLQVLAGYAARWKLMADRWVADRSPATPAETWNSGVKPCPWCGGQPTIIHPDNDCAWDFITCWNDDCLARPFTRGNDPDDALRRWNTRAPLLCEGSRDE